MPNKNTIACAALSFCLGLAVHPFHHGPPHHPPGGCEIASIDDEGQLCLVRFGGWNKLATVTSDTFIHAGPKRMQVGDLHVGLFVRHEISHPTPEGFVLDDIDVGLDGPPGEGAGPHAPWALLGLIPTLGVWYAARRPSV